MRIAEEVKTALIILSKQSWLLGTHFEAFHKKITVHPDYAKSVVVLLQAGLYELQKERCFLVNLRNEIYIQLDSFEQTPSPEDFFQQWELAIDKAIAQLAINWTRMEMDTGVIYTYPYENKWENLDDLLLNLTRHSTITISTINSTFIHRPQYFTILGQEEELLEFLSLLSKNSSPLAAIPNKAETDKPSLQKLCLNKIARQLNRERFFYPVESLSPALQKQVEEARWERIDNAQGVKPYAGKVILFKTDNELLKHNSCFIDPKNKSIIVGLISDWIDEWQEEDGYTLHLLIKHRATSSNHALVASAIKYSNFVVRNPTLGELHQIYNMIDKKIADIEYHKSSSILQKINEQIEEFLQESSTLLPF